MSLRVPSFHEQVMLLKAKSPEDSLWLWSKEFILKVIQDNFGALPVYLFGSRSRGVDSPSADVDLWLDGELSAYELAELRFIFEESVVPYHVDLVTTSQLKGVFGSEVKRDAIRWQ